MTAPSGPGSTREQLRQAAGLPLAVRAGASNGRRLRRTPARTGHCRGAGPVGTTAALLLADAGIGVIVLERHAEPHALPRAVHLDDEVVGTLSRAGVGAEFLASSRSCSGLRLLDARHQVMAELGPGRVRGARRAAGQHVPPAGPGGTAARPGSHAPAHYPAPER